MNENPLSNIDTPRKFNGNDDSTLSVTKLRGQHFGAKWGRRLPLSMLIET